MWAACVNCAGVSTPRSVLRQREARLQEVGLEACQMLLGRLESGAVEPGRIQEHILQVLAGGPHLLPERLHRGAIGAERLPHLGLLVIGQTEGMQQLPAKGPAVPMHAAARVGDARDNPARSDEQSKAHEFPKTHWVFLSLFRDGLFGDVRRCCGHGAVSLLQCAV
jgi:hypothetical protein